MGSMTGVPVIPTFCPMSLQEGRSETLNGPSPSLDKSLELMSVPVAFVSRVPDETVSGAGLSKAEAPT